MFLAAKFMCHKAVFLRGIKLERTNLKVIYCSSFNLCSEDKQPENPSAWLKTQNEIETQAGALILWVIITCVSVNKAQAQRKGLVIHMHRCVPMRTHMCVHAHTHKHKHFFIASIRQIQNRGLYFQQAERCLFLPLFIENVKYVNVLVSVLERTIMSTVNICHLFWGAGKRKSEKNFYEF